MGRGSRWRCWTWAACSVAISGYAWSEQAGSGKVPGGTNPTWASPPAGMVGDAPSGGLTGDPVDQILRKRQEQLLKMHDLLHRIRDAKDDKEREKLKDEQLKLMKEQLHDIREQRMQMNKAHTPKRRPPHPGGPPPQHPDAPAPDDTDGPPEP